MNLDASNLDFKLASDEVKFRRVTSLESLSLAQLTPPVVVKARLAALIAAISASS